MEQLLALAADWWWIAPAAIGAGAVSYAALTAGRRRARRLELDAARHDVREARQSLAAAKAHVRTAQADVIAARTQSYPAAAGAASPVDARAALQRARQAEKAAALRVRASHARVKAALAHYNARSATTPLPLERLMAAHDAVTARWIEYETDAAKALTYPQLLDSRHPSTLAFLQAQREALRLRPSSAQARLTGADFSAYRSAVAAAEAAFDAAERDARIAAGERPSAPAGPALFSGTASALGEAAAVLSDAAAAGADRLRAVRWRELLSGDFRRAAGADAGQAPSPYGSAAPAAPASSSPSAPPGPPASAAPGAPSPTTPAGSPAKPTPADSPAKPAPADSPAAPPPTGPSPASPPPAASAPKAGDLAAAPASAHGDSAPASSPTPASATEQSRPIWPVPARDGRSPHRA